MKDKRGIFFHKSFDTSKEKCVLDLMKKSIVHFPDTMSAFFDNHIIFTILHSPENYVLETDNDFVKEGYFLDSVTKKAYGDEYVKIIIITNLFSNAILREKRENQITIINITPDEISHNNFIYFIHRGLGMILYNYYNRRSEDEKEFEKRGIEFANYFKIKSENMQRSWLFEPFAYQEELNLLKKRGPNWSVLTN